MDKVPASLVASGMHIEADTEHFSHRDGTLPVGADFDKNPLGKHDIEKIDTHTLDHLKKTADGRTSLNWSWRKKHIVLFVLTYCTLMTDMSSAWSIPLVITQAEYWGISPSNAGGNLSGNIFMLGMGGIAAVPATRWLGRLPVLFWSMTIALFMSVFAAAAPGWISHIVARCLLGFFVTAPQVVGLSMLHDMFFFHEHARKIGIWAGTGFETSFEPRFPVVRRDGYSLALNWGKEKPCESYMGAVVARFPNFFVFNPPICPVIGSAFPGIQATSQYIMRMVDRLQHDCLKSIVVKESAQVEFNQLAQQRMQEMAFTGNCKSWYKHANGKVFIPWPGTILHYIHATSLVRWEDFDFVFENPHQKYASLGNGVPPEGFAPESPPWLRKPRSALDSNGSCNGHGT